MTSLLSSTHKKQLSEWLGRNKTFQFLYSASRDGCGSAIFHTKCDNKGPTVVVLRNGAGFVFGGYTSMNWNTKTGTTNDGKAFLFRLDKNGNFDPRKYNVKADMEAFAINNGAGTGPNFGKSEVLVCRTGPYTKAGGYFPCEYKLTLGETYDMKGDGAQDFTGNNTQIEDIEVFAVKDTAFEWRIVSKGSHQNLMSYMENYAPPEGSKVKAVNLLLLGAVGAGKSSFCNSIDSIFQREVTSIARCGNAERSLTTTYRRYRVRSSETGEALKLRLCDTRGLESEGGLDIVDLMAVLEGHIPDRFEFNPTTSVTSDTRGYNKNPTPDDNIHCIAFVIDGTTIEVFPEKMLHLFKSLQQKANAKGCPQVIILTKADKVSSEVFADVGTMFFSNAIGDLVEAAGQLFGLPRSYVFPVKNYEDEVEINGNVNFPLLLCLKQATKYADNYIKDSLASD